VTMLVNATHSVATLLPIADGMAAPESVELLGLVDNCRDAEFPEYLYNDSPYGPPQVWALFPSQVMKHRPSVVDVLPLMSALPQ
jgi:hypothetical protein